MKRVKLWNQLPIRKIDGAGRTLAVYASASEAGRENYMHYMCVLNRCRGRTGDHFDSYGFSFRFLEEGRHEPT